MNLKISNINESFVKLDCEAAMLHELSDRFTFDVQNAKFMPSYKAGIWDGKIRLINSRNSTTHKGLVPNIIDYCIESNYTAEFSDEYLNPFKRISSFSAKKLKVPHTFRDFQLNCFNIAMKKKRQVFVSSTGSGKSLMIYSIMRAMLYENKKTLIIVPTISLVEQLYKDFDGYSNKDEVFNAKDLVHKIHSGAEKNSDLPVTISTWQSLQKLPAEYFKQFRCVIADEVHLFDAKACTTIMDKCTKAFNRFGFTGTLKESKTHELSLIGLFGPVTHLSNTSELIKEGILSEMDIKCITLKHKTTNNLISSSTNYHEEMQYLFQHERRREFLSNLCKKTTGNTLLLFFAVEKHGIPMHEMMKDQIPEKDVHLIYGGTGVHAREEIRELTENSNDKIIVASVGVFSTGINIKNIHNIVLASPTKSTVRILQSIGRGLRIGKSLNDHLTVWDISDDLREGRKKNNYTLNHFIKRWELYNQNGFNTTLHKYHI